MPIPDSNLPGHQRLHDRVVRALGLLQEAQSVDFKRSATWDDLWVPIVKNALAMGNLRDGGVIIVGVAEDGGTWRVTGIEAQHLSTFDVDDVVAKVNAYASPYAQLDIVRVTHGGLQFLAIQIREFRDTPLICKKNGPDGSGLAEGAFYVRPPGLAQATRIRSADQMRDLLELAAEKRARQILEQSERVRPRLEESEHKLNDELGGL